MPVKDEALLRKGEALVNLGRFQEAKECFDAAIKLNPDRAKDVAETWIKKGSQRLADGEYDEARKCFDKAASLDQNWRDECAQRWINRGKKLMEDGKSEEALKCFDETISKDIYKLIVAGDMCSGKTALVVRYCKGVFKENIQSTMGVDFAVNKLNLHGEEITLQIWDLGGAEVSRRVAPLYCKGASAAIVAFDITESSSFRSLPEWVGLIRMNAGDIPIVLAGMKADLEDRRVVKTEDGVIFSSKNKLSGYFEVSSRTGLNVDEVFALATELVYDARALRYKESSRNQRRPEIVTQEQMMPKPWVSKIPEAKVSRCTPQPEKAAVEIDRTRLKEEWERSRMEKRKGYSSSAGAKQKENRSRNSVASPDAGRVTPSGVEAYEVVLSFAGEDREYAKAVADYLKQNNVRVFYDQYEEVSLWGKELTEFFDKVYRGSAHYCVMFISKHYADKVWTTLERRSALAKAVQEKGEYILPARFDDTELPGLRPTIGYVDLRRKTPQELGKMILQKLGKPTR